MKILLSISLIVSLNSFSEETKTISQKDYISIYSEEAKSQMNRFRIPASITLAQGILESGNGNSKLAREGNNHFGIKCHDWKGEKMYLDDDKANECFRKYTSAKESFEDHSVFLGKTRYKSLFSLDITDYKAWANGLKAAGYATNPKYADELIKLIETLSLNQYDGKVGENKNGENALASTLKTEQIQLEDVVYETHKVSNHKTQEIRFIVAKKGDTYYKISKEFNLGMWQLYAYNDFAAKKDILIEGDLIYLEPKANKAPKSKASYTASKEINLAEVSQIEGIKLSKLMKMNGFESDNVIVKKGQKILLR